MRLQAEGLLILQPNRGFEVRRLSLPERQEVFALRLKLEPELTAEGCLQANDGERRLAKRLLVDLNRAMDKDASRVPPLNMAFHMALMSPSRKPITLQILERLLTTVRVQVGALPAFEGAKREHAEILEAWSGGNAAEVYRLVEEHIRSSLGQLTFQ